MKGKTSCKYYKVCGNGYNCQRCKGYIKRDNKNGKGGKK
jgi:hypothetical protein